MADTTNEEMIKILHDLYNESKTMILEQTCALNMVQGFMDTAIKFVSKSNDLDVQKEATILRQILQNDRMHDHKYFHAEICVLQKKYTEALAYLKDYQKMLGATFGNHGSVRMPNCYI
jgi:hypothetical protein